MSSALTRPVSILPQGTSVSRYIAAKAIGRGDLYTELQTAEKWLDTPQTLELRQKSAVTAGSTTDSTWAAPLSAYGITAEALTIMAPTVPHRLRLLDPSAMLNSNSGPKFDLDVSEQAAFQFYSAPAEPTAAATIVHSVYQRDLIAIKALRWSARLNPSPTRPRVL